MTRHESGAQALLTPAWERVVIGPEDQVDRRLYTFCVLERLQDGLRRRDLFVPASRRRGLGQLCDPHCIVGRPSTRLGR